jgi:hypothetical protein
MFTSTEHRASKLFLDNCSATRSGTLIGSNAGQARVCMKRVCTVRQSSHKGPVLKGGCRMAVLHSASSRRQVTVLPSLLELGCLIERLRLASCLEVEVRGIEIRGLDLVLGKKLCLFCRLLRRV